MKSFKISILLVLAVVAFVAETKDSGSSGIEPYFWNRIVLFEGELNSKNYVPQSIYRKIMIARESILIKLLTGSNCILIKHSP